MSAGRQRSAATDSVTPAGPELPYEPPPVRQSSTHSRAASPVNLLRALHDIARQVAGIRGRERDYQVLRRYYGLDGSPRFVLEEIGAQLGVTRERARQLRDRMEAALSAALEGGGAPSLRFAVPEGVPLEARAVREMFGGSPPFRGEGVLVGILRDRYGEAGQVVGSPLLPLLFKLLGGRSVSPDRLGLQGEERYWTFRKGLDVDVFRRIVTRSRTLLLSNLEGVTWSDLVAEANRGQASAVGEGQVREAAALMDEVEAAGSGGVRVRFESLPSNADRAFRILTEQGSPLHFREIADRIDQRLVDAGRDPIIRDPRTVAGPMSSDRRFEAIGRSGRWKLAAWDHVRAESILELIVEALERKGEPATYDEVHRYVVRRRADVPRATIPALAPMYPEHLVRVGRGMLALPSFGLSPQKIRGRRSSGEVYEAVRQVILGLLERKGAGASLRVVEVVSEAREQHGVPEATVRNRLQRSPWARLSMEGGSLRVRVDVAALEAAGARARQEVAAPSPVQDRVSSLIRKHLEERPDRCCPVRELRAVLREQAGVKDPTIYWVLSRMPEIRKEMDGRVLTVRLSASRAGAAGAAGGVASH